MPGFEKHLSYSMGKEMNLTYLWWESAARRSVFYVCCWAANVNSPIKFATDKKLIRWREGNESELCNMQIQTAHEKVKIAHRIETVDTGSFETSTKNLVTRTPTDAILAVIPDHHIPSLAIIKKSVSLVPPTFQKLFRTITSPTCG